MSLVPLAATAQEDPAFSDVPFYLLERMNRSVGAEDYVKHLTQELQRGDLDGNGLDGQDIEMAEQMRSAQYRASTLQSVVLNDLDADGAVTKEEAERAARYQLCRGDYGENSEVVQKRIAQVIEQIMKYDTDGDGKVTIAEGLKAARPEGRRQREFERYEQLIALDPNKDGRITVSELDALARQAFQQVDYDHDGTLSSAEIKLLEPARQLQREIHSAMPCDLPKPADGDLVTVLGIYDGVLQPNVSVAGQNETTQLTVIDVEPGEQPVYLVLTSYQSMIWQFRGATERLARVIAIRNRIGENRPEIAGAGVMGIEQDKVTFLPPGSCGRAFNKIASREANVMKRMVERATGHAVDALRGAYNSTMISLPSGTPQAKAQEKDLLVPGEGNDVVVLGKNAGVRILRAGESFSLVQHEDWLASPDNVVTVDPDDVLAPGKVETYDVLPHQYGLRQLANEGKLERTPDGYRIVTSIPRFPTGLSGAHRVTFILPEGMPMPTGESGHSQIVLEKKAAQ